MDAIRGLPLLLVALGAASCASAPAGPTAAEVEAESRQYNGEIGAHFAGGPSAEDSLAFGLRWAERFESLAKSGDPDAADAAYETLMLVLSNHFITEANAGLEPTAAKRYLDAMETWFVRNPESKRIGMAADLVFGVAQEEPLVSRALAVLRRMDASPHFEVRSAALLATGQVHRMAEREEEAAAAFERVVREYPGTPEAGIAARELKQRGIRPGAEAPDFEVADLSGGRVRLSTLRGKAVLLNFWGMG